MPNSGDSLLINLFLILIPAFGFLLVSFLISRYLILRYTRALSRLYKMNFNSLESERKRIANDMHDIMGNKMIHINQSLFELGQDLNESSRSKLNIVNSNLSLLSSEVKRSIEALYPRDLLHGDFNTCLKNLAYDLSNNDFKVNVEIFNPFNLDAHRGLHLFRLIQEKLSNVSKHGKTRNVQINLSTDNGKYYVALIYKGDPPPTWKINSWIRPNKGRGLHIIQDRLHILNAKNSITQSDGNVIDEISIAYEVPTA
jgi:two-component system, NarL family, sensor kinase